MVSNHYFLLCVNLPLREIHTPEVHMVRPGYSHRVSLPTSPGILATSPYPETDSAFFEPSHLTSAADEGAVQVSRRTISSNSFSPEVFVLPVDVEKHLIDGDCQKH
ncbi:rubicon like autophagy enhancer [Homo sapiens]|uniref:Rubicon like autophagy enhancer n=1 Tax=Homo sapiens TaxID=9606 RepID=A0A6Q8PGJ9_HUMAN|nr:rubicon like autophagy enhancer [Homo sapiens]